MTSTSVRASEFSANSRIAPWQFAIVIFLFPFFLLNLVHEELCYFVAFLVAKRRSSIDFFCRTRGSSFCIKKDFLDPDDIQQIQSLLLKLISNPMHVNILSIEGSCRYKLKSYAHEQLLELEGIQKIHRQVRSFTTRRMTLSFMYSVTDPHAGSEQRLFASHQHIDSFRHQLKVLIPLSNVTTNDGPTEVLRGSHRFNLNLLVNYFLAWVFELRIIRGKKQFLSQKQISAYDNNPHKSELTANLCDIILLNTRAIHRAQRLTGVDSRKILWLYYD